jgi:hypothetical protein
MLPPKYEKQSFLQMVIIRRQKMFSAVWWLGQDRIGLDCRCEEKIEVKK